MITSLQNKTVKELLKLKQKKYRKDYYLVETNHLVEEAIKAKQTDLIISTEPVDLGVENLVVSKEIMEKLAFTKTPQPIMARCFIQKDKKLVDGKRYLILDYLQDPGNIGTLIRTALAFGIDQVILSNECVDLYNDKINARSTLPSFLSLWGFKRNYSCFKRKRCLCCRQCFRKWKAYS